MGTRARLRGWWRRRRTVELTTMGECPRCGGGLVMDGRGNDVEQRADFECLVCGLTGGMSAVRVDNGATAMPLAPCPMEGCAGTWSVEFRPTAEELPEDAVPPGYEGRAPWITCDGSCLTDEPMRFTGFDEDGATWGPPA